MTNQVDYFESPKNPTIEKDLNRLSKEINRHYENEPKTQLSSREVLKKSIGSAYNIPVRQPTTQKQSSILPQYLENASLEDKAKVEKLINLAFHDGLEKAVNEAKKESPFILDAFHEVLVDKIYPLLKQRGDIK